MSLSPAVAFIPLARLHGVFGPLLTVAGERTTHIVALFEFPVTSASDETLVRSRVDQLAARFLSPLGRWHSFSSSHISVNYHGEQCGKHRAVSRATRPRARAAFRLRLLASVRSIGGVT